MTERRTVITLRGDDARPAFRPAGPLTRGACHTTERRRVRPSAGRLLGLLAGGVLFATAGLFGLSPAPASAAAFEVVHGTGSATGTSPGNDAASATATNGLAVAAAGLGSTHNKHDTATAVASGGGVAIALAGIGSGRNSNDTASAVAGGGGVAIAVAG